MDKIELLAERSLLHERLNSAIIHIQRLREVTQAILDKSDVEVHPGECHCVLCEAQHVLAVTSGYADDPIKPSNRVTGD